MCDFEVCIRENYQAVFRSGHATRFTCPCLVPELPTGQAHMCPVPLPCFCESSCCLGLTILVGTEQCHPMALIYISPWLVILNLSCIFFFFIILLSLVKLPFSVFCEQFLGSSLKLRDVHFLRAEVTARTVIVLWV